MPTASERIKEIISKRPPVPLLPSTRERAMNLLKILQDALNNSETDEEYLLNIQNKPQKSWSLESPGFVYIMKSLATSLYKIGFSGNPRKRLSEIRNADPSVFLVASSKGSRRDETALHWKFLEARINREWFSFSDTQATEAIQSITALKS